MLNPLRALLTSAGLEAQGRPSPFQVEADAALSGFQAVRHELERQVKHGDITLKVARERASSAADEMRSRLTRKSEGYSPIPRAFLDRLVEADKSRKKARESLSIEGLQRETNHLLRQHLVEQQLQTRVGEFEGKTFVRPIIGGVPAPTLDSMLAFHSTAVNSGDDVAVEWTRRQLEGFRSRVFGEDDLRKIDLATNRPDHVNPRLVGVYVDALKDRPAEEQEIFADKAIEQKDANACIAAFVLARQVPEGAGARWVRKVLASLPEFPDAALSTLRGLEAEARASEAEAAKAQARFAIARVEAEVNLDGIVAPTERDLERLGKIHAKPLAMPGEALGLNLSRRGAIDEDEIATFRTTSAE
jgi:hypothetical protein